MDESKDNILNQETWNPIAPESIGGFLKIDLNKVDLVTYSLNKRFRQGENGADLKLWFYDGQIPHQLNPDSSAITLYGMDANEKIKVVSASPDTDWQSGRVTMYLPSQCFTSAGQYNRMLIEVASSNQVIATINFNLDVLPNDFYNINIGSEHFSNQINDEIYDKLKEFSDKASSSAVEADNAIAKFKSDYDSLNTLSKNIQESLDNNDVVSKVTLDDAIAKVSSKVYKSSDIEWQTPFKSWTNAGGTSLSVHDGIVEMSLSAISTANGSTICMLPVDCRPKSEKIGIGISMDGQGHDSESVFVSIMPDGRVIVQNNTHDIAKIIVQSTYTLEVDESEKNNDSDVSIISDITTPTNNPIAGSFKSINVYAPNGTVGRQLDINQTFAIIQLGTLNNRTVGRVATSEWVYLDEVAYSYVVKSGTITTNSSAQVGYHESGLQFSMNLTDKTPYTYTRKMEVDGKTGYKVATDQYVDSQYGTVS